MVKKSKGDRAYILTLFNYTDLDIEIWETMECQTMLFAKEVCPDTGRPHLQGFVYWEHQKTMTACKAMFLNNQVHVEVKSPYSTFQSCYEYIIGNCYPAKKKHLPPPRNYKPKNDWVFMSGEMPMDQDEKGEANKWDWIKQLHEEDADESQFPAWYTIAQRRTYEANKAAYDLKRKPSRLNYYPGLWIYGDLNCGKSEQVRINFPNHYVKSHDKWWCGYERENEVWLEEVNPGWSGIAYWLKTWGDKGPFRAEAKYGNKGIIRPKKIIVTSNYSIDECIMNSAERSKVHKRFREIHLTRQFTEEEQKDFEENGVVIDTLKPFL